MILFLIPDYFEPQVDYAYHWTEEGFYLSARTLNEAGEVLEEVRLDDFERTAEMIVHEAIESGCVEFLTDAVCEMLAPDQSPVEVE